MRNRAKCKKCNSIIESFHSTDYVSCSCGAISVSEGMALSCSANDWKDFVRVDDEGNEIIPKIVEMPSKQNPEVAPPSKKELIDMLHEMLMAAERLPENAKSSYITHYDYMALIMLLEAIFKSDQP